MKFVYLGIKVLAALTGVFLLASAQPQTDGPKRGEYPVERGQCGDCHTPTKLEPSGPKTDSFRLLSGHPEDLVMKSAPSLPEGLRILIASETMPARSGPQAMSFISNRTPG